jgi:hypothetical protein
MAFLGSKIDRSVAVNNNTAGGGGITILPDDEYELEAFETDVTPNSKGTGKNFEGKVRVLDGPHKGTWFFFSITSIEHESAQAQTIGQGQLRALSEATGTDFDTLEDSKQLEYKAFFAHVGHETYYSKKHSKDVTKNTITKFLWEGMPEGDDAPPAEKSAPRQETRREEPVKQEDATEGRRWQKRA